jgi:phosphoribosylformimino-5-aminoimidazole carboxamide ribotide isomerase
VKLYPAIDMLGGHAVRLVRGDFDAKKVYDESPVAAAQAWVRAGARRLHVVDLDGARAGAPANIEHLRAIVAESGVPVQFGGGLRTAEAVAEALAAGAERVILGTVAFTEPELLRQVLEEHSPERVLVGVDVRGGHVATHGWLQTTEAPTEQAFAALRQLGARHFIFTNIDHDGMLDGASREEVLSVARAVGDGSLIFSGGIGAIGHLQALAELRAAEQLDGLDGVIVGTALYEHRFTVAEAREALGD